MPTLDEDFILPPVHAGGLSCHGMAPLVNHPADKGHVEPRTVLFNLSGHELLDINVDAASGGRGRQKHRRI